MQPRLTDTDTDIELGSPTLERTPSFGNNYDRSFIGTMGKKQEEKEKKLKTTSNPDEPTKPRDKDSCLIA